MNLIPATESKIILISDLLDSRKQKEKELVFYNEELNKLLEKMNYLNREIKLTNNIIQMIEQERIRDLGIKPK
jgi:hypothetical protein